MKKYNSVFNNFNKQSKYNNAKVKKNYGSRKGFLDSQTEFANEFYEEVNPEECHEYRKRNDSFSYSSHDNADSRKLE